MKQNKQIQVRLPHLVFINAVLLLLIALLFVLFNTDYQEKLRDQNLLDIANINRSAANIADIFFNNRQSRLASIEKYVHTNQLDLEETLTFIAQSNVEENAHYELIAEDFRGFLVSNKSGETLFELDYTKDGYANLQKIFRFDTDNDLLQTIAFTPVFTDQFTANKSFALYTRLILLDENNQEKAYTLMYVSMVDDFLKMINIDGGYADMTTALIDSKGKYIVNTLQFRSDDFFQYIHDYNAMSLDEKNILQAQFYTDENGFLFYKDSRSRDSVFSYSRIADTEWYAVSAVPLSSFHNNRFEFRFTVLIVGVLLLIMLVNGIWLLHTNQSLKVSAEKERIASEAKTDFLSRMSHDIRTPLNGIIGLTDLAIHEDNNPVTADYLEKIAYSGNFLLGLVNDVLDMNKVESGKMELRPTAYNYVEFVKNINSVVRSLCEAKGVNFTIQNPSGLDQRYFLVDKMRFNQIIVNLLSNSVKFTPEDGTIKLIFDQQIKGENMLIKIQVSDSGIGMSEEFQRRMFEPFSQEHKVPSAGQSGTGLGLAIVNNLVALMRGDISVESMEGVGTTFFIQLEVPLADEQDSIPVLLFDEKTLEGKQILICEDNEFNALIIKKLMEMKHINYAHADNGQKAVEMITSSPPGTFDAILMDVRMPVMNGLEATRAIRAIDREDTKVIPIIAMTANAFDQDVQDTYTAGMNAHLAKPVDSTLLFQTICEQIDKVTKK